MAVWEGRGSIMEEGGSFKIWGRMGGWTSKLGRGIHGVVCGKVFTGDGRISAKIVSLLLGRGIE